jgi:hypothetical protein
MTRIKPIHNIPFSQRKEFILPVEDCKFLNGRIWLKFFHPIIGEKLVYSFQEEWIAQYKYYFYNSELLFSNDEEITEKDLIGRLVKVHIGENNKVEKISRVYENDVLDELADEFIEWLEKEKGITTMEELEYFMKHNKMPEVKLEKEQALLF